ncbi:MAG TPA: hypothetical protein VMV94_12455 [Phycisphaerae bacterium]|nr:hypothetical protein [Phycisphaerae bacterium]
MRREVGLVSALAMSLIATQASYAGDVDVAYTLTNLGTNHWQYTYDVTNNALVLTVEEFTIWFDLADFRNLSITTPDPPSSNWDELVTQPDPLLGDDGYYDALALSAPIGVGQSVQGFSVAFEWLGPGIPGQQPFDIVDPVTFQPILSGWTLPEPASFLLPLLAVLFLRRR